DKIREWNKRKRELDQEMEMVEKKLKTNKVHRLYQSDCERCDAQDYIERFFECPHLKDMDLTLLEKIKTQIFNHTAVIEENGSSMVGRYDIHIEVRTLRYLHVPCTEITGEHDHLSDEYDKPDSKNWHVAVWQDNEYMSLDKIDGQDDPLQKNILQLDRSLWLGYLFCHALRDNPDEIQCLC